VSRTRGGLALPVLFALIAFVTFCGLGVWQLDRQAWKQGLIATLKERTGAAPVELPPPAAWERLEQADDEFRRVTFRAEFPPGRAVLVYTGGTPLRPDVKTPGYFVFAPARLPGGAVVVVNRGFAPEPRTQAGAHPNPQGVVELTGALRWPERAGAFVTEYDEASDTWFVRNHIKMAARNDWGYPAQFYVDLEGPAPAGGVPRPGPLNVNLRDDHLQYAITWFALAAVVAVMFVLWLRGRRRASIGRDPP
jgi:cytochrome oxidase assembly protein ShyY1